MNQQNPPPSIAQSVVPHLICDGAADAIEFYKKAFAAEEMMRLPGKDGRLMHACIKIGNCCVFLVDESPAWGALGPKSLKGSPVTVHLNVPDVDATMASCSGGRGERWRCRRRTCSGATAMARSSTRLAIIGRSPRTCAM